MIWQIFNTHSPFDMLDDWSFMSSITTVASGPPQHRRGGQRARRTWKRRRAAGAHK